MAQNTDERIIDLRNMAQRHGYGMIIAFAVSVRRARAAVVSGEYEICSYGASVALCGVAAHLAEELGEMVDSGRWPAGTPLRRAGRSEMNALASALQSIADGPPTCRPAQTGNDDMDMVYNLQATAKAALKELQR